MLFYKYFILILFVSRPMRDSSWITASKHVKPTDRIYSVVDLYPGTAYQIKVSASNNAGDTEALYNFTTFTFAGSEWEMKAGEQTFHVGVVPVVPELSPPVSHSGDESMYFNAKVLVPIVSSLVISVAIFVTLLYRKSEFGYQLFPLALTRVESKQ